MAGRPFGSKNGTPMSCVPDTMRPYMKITALLTMKQLSEVLGMSYGAVRALKSRDPEALPKPIRVGGAYRYRATDVDAWILAQKQIP